MERLNAAVTEALADPTVRGKLASIGQDVFAADRQNGPALDAVRGGNSGVAAATSPAVEPVGSHIN
jgi:hypothetical protein